MLPKKNTRGLSDHSYGIDSDQLPNRSAALPHEKSGPRFGYWGGVWLQKRLQVTVIARDRYHWVGLLDWRLPRASNLILRWLSLKNWQVAVTSKSINSSIPPALNKWGYTDKQIEEIIRYTRGAGTIKGGPYINPETLKSKGFTEEILAKVEGSLPQDF